MSKKMNNDKNPEMVMPTRQKADNRKAETAGVNIQEAETAEVDSQKADIQKAETAGVDSQKADIQKAETAGVSSQKAEAKKVETSNKQVDKKKAEKARQKQQKQNRKKKKPGRLARREALVGLCFIAPWIIGAITFLAYPLGSSFYYALNNIRMTPLRTIYTFVAQENFVQILISDQEFLPGVINYVVSTLVSVPVVVVFALIIAIMLNQNIKGKGLFRLIFFLPVIIVSGPVLGKLGADGAGTISVIDVQSITAAVKAYLPESLAKPISELFSNMVTILWYAGVPILIFLSSLQKIDSSMYEAAKIDGGSGWECFWKITLPTIKPMILLNFVYTIVFMSNTDQNSIIQLIKNSMFSGIQEKGYGYASAMAWMYAVIELLIVGLFAVMFLAKKDVYERQVKKAKRAYKKQQREVKKIERRSARHAKKRQRAGK